MVLGFLMQGGGGGFLQRILAKRSLGSCGFRRAFEIVMAV